MHFSDKNNIVKVLQELIQFPINLKISDWFDINVLVDLLVDHYTLSKSALKIDFDKVYTRIDIKELYERIFRGIELKGTVVMQPLYRESRVETVTFQAADLYSFLLGEHPRMTKRFKLEGVGEEDVLFIFVDQRLLVNINHRGSSYICRVGKDLVATQPYLRPTLLFGKVFLWPHVLMKGNYKLKYDSRYSEGELSKLSLVVDDLLEFPPGVTLGKKYPFIAQNISLEACNNLKGLLGKAGIHVTIEEEFEFKNMIQFQMPIDQSDLLGG
jgi:hypothetical protein